MSGMTFDDLAAEAGAAAEQTQGGGKSTGEWVAETVELLDKRGLLEPMLFGPEGAAEVREQMQQDAAAAAQERAASEGEPDAEGDGGGGGLDLDAEGIAAAGGAIMDQLGEDVTVAEVVEICEANPALVNKQIQENL